MINFEKKEWFDPSDSRAIPISPANLNRIENGIEESFEEIAYANLKNLVIQKISSSCEWIAPKAVKNKFKVFCVGGGGGGGVSYLDYNGSYKRLLLGAGGGGGGYISIAELEIDKDTTIPIVCGAGGGVQEDGGKTTFGNYLSADGGQAGESYLNSNSNYHWASGGNGGAGGGGAGYENYAGEGLLPISLNGGNGGNGYYGAGGAGTLLYAESSHDAPIDVYWGNKGVSNKHGDGGMKNVIPKKKGTFMTGSFLDCLFNQNLIKAINPSIESSEFDGSGGNGSYGGNGRTSYGGGGGGGFCGDGGNAAGCSGGGGGGYFCNGGNALQPSYSDYKNGKLTGNGGGGGGFFHSGSSTGIGGDGGVLIMYIKEDE